MELVQAYSSFSDKDLTTAWDDLGAEVTKIRHRYNKDIAAKFVDVRQSAYIKCLLQFSVVETWALRPIIRLAAQFGSSPIERFLEQIWVKCCTQQKVFDEFRKNLKHCISDYIDKEITKDLKLAEKAAFKRSIITHSATVGLLLYTFELDSDTFKLLCRWIWSFLPEPFNTDENYQQSHELITVTLNGECVMAELVWFLAAHIGQRWRRLRLTTLNTYSRLKLSPGLNLSELVIESDISALCPCALVHHTVKTGPELYLRYNVSGKMLEYVSSVDPLGIRVVTTHKQGTWNFIPSHILHTAHKIFTDGANTLVTIYVGHTLVWSQGMGFCTFGEILQNVHGPVSSPLLASWLNIENEYSIKRIKRRQAIKQNVETATVVGFCMSASFLAGFGAVATYGRSLLMLPVLMNIQEQALQKWQELPDTKRLPSCEGIIELIEINETHDKTQQYKKLLNW